MKKEPQNEKKNTIRQEFGDGKALEIVENSEGELAISLSAGGKKVFDFKELLPENYTFISSEQADKLSGPNPLYPGMRTNFNEHRIEIGDINSPKAIIEILHEIGHATRDPGSKEYAERRALIEKFVKTPEEKMQDAKVRSKIERRAWVYAITKMRELDKNSVLDSKEIFPKFADLKEYIGTYLSACRENAEHSLKDDPDFESELQKLF